MNTNFFGLSQPDNKEYFTRIKVRIYNTIYDTCKVSNEGEYLRLDLVIIDEKVCNFC